MVKKSAHVRPASIPWLAACANISWEHQGANARIIPDEQGLNLDLNQQMKAVYQKIHDNGEHNGVKGQYQLICPAT